MKGGDEAISRHSTEYNRAKLLPLLGQVMRVYLGKEHCQHHGQNGYQVHLPPVLQTVTQTRQKLHEPQTHGSHLNVHNIDTKNHLFWRRKKSVQEKAMEKAVPLSLGALGWLSSHPKSKAKHLAGGEWRWLTHVWMSYGGEQEWRSGSTNTAICFGLEQISAAFWGTISQHFQYVGRTMWSSMAKSTGARQTASGSRGDESKQLAQDIQDPSFQKTAPESWNKEDSTPSGTSSFLYRHYKAAPQGVHCAN